MVYAVVSFGSAIDVFNTIEEARELVTELAHSFETAYVEEMEDVDND